MRLPQDATLQPESTRGRYNQPPETQVGLQFVLSWQGDLDQVYISSDTFVTVNRQRVCDDPHPRRRYITHLDQYEDGMRLIRGIIVPRCDDAPSGKCLEIRVDSYSISHLPIDRESMQEANITPSRSFKLLVVHIDDNLLLHSRRTHSSGFFYLQKIRSPEVLTYRANKNTGNCFCEHENGLL